MYFARGGCSWGSPFSLIPFRKGFLEPTPALPLHRPRWRGKARGRSRAASSCSPWACQNWGNGRACWCVWHAPFLPRGRLQYGGGQLRGPGQPPASSRCEADALVGASSPEAGRRLRRGALPVPPGRLACSPGQLSRPPLSPRPAGGPRGRAASAPAPPPPRRQRAAQRRWAAPPCGGGWRTWPCCWRPRWATWWSTCTRRSGPAVGARRAGGAEAVSVRDGRGFAPCAGRWKPRIKLRAGQLAAGGGAAGGGRLQAALAAALGARMAPDGSGSAGFWPPGPARGRRCRAGGGRAARFPAAPRLAVRLPRRWGPWKFPAVRGRRGRWAAPRLSRRPLGSPSALLGGTPARGPGSEPGPSLGPSQLEVYLPARPPKDAGFKLVVSVNNTLTPTLCFGVSRRAWVLGLDPNECRDFHGRQRSPWACIYVFEIRASSAVGKFGFFFLLCVYYTRNVY